MFCPEGSSRPSGAGECPPGFYCPTGIRLACPVGTYCPREGHWDPMPCPPGQFSAMVGQEACTNCPRGYICPGFGRIDPTPCPAGMVCSRDLLTSPNQRCPPGVYRVWEEQRSLRLRMLSEIFCNCLGFAETSASWVARDVQGFPKVHLPFEKTNCF